VRKFVEELKDLPAAEIHAPGDADKSTLARAGITLGQTYPKKIVDHAQARLLALAALKTVTAAKEKPAKPRGG
jgi:deoxyribodipyrimidine photo-lyase